MKVVTIKDSKKETFSNPLFTGSDVTRQVLIPDSRCRPAR